MSASRVPIASDDEWWPIPGFLAYEMTRSRRIRHKYLAREIFSSNGTVMLERGVRRYHRSIEALHRETFGREYPVIDLFGFKVIPGAPGYSINDKGEVFNERWRSFLKQSDMGTVVLVIDGKQVRRSVRRLIQQTFGR